MKLGFIGLGQMGRPIAHNLMKGVERLAVCNRSVGAFAEFESKGATASTDPASLGDADVVFLCLPSDGVVRSFLFDGRGPAAWLRRGQIVVDLSTVSHSFTCDAAEMLAAAGIWLIDAPISGMEARAIDATLTVMCGGKRDIFDRVQPLLRRIGSNILYMGESGSGQLTKLVNQLLFDVNAAALAEILPMSVKMGLDPRLIGEVVNSGTGRSYASEFFIPRQLRGHFTDGYPMAHAYKDLISGAELGAQFCLSMPVLAAATSTYQMALLNGHGDKDKGAMLCVFEDLFDVKFRDGN